MTVTRHLPDWLAFLGNPLTGALLIISGFALLAYLARQQPPQDSVLVLPYELPRRISIWRKQWVRVARHPILLTAVATVASGIVLGAATWLIVQNVKAQNQDELGGTFIEFHEKGFVPGSDDNFFQKGDRKGPITLHRLFLNENFNSIRVLIETTLSYDPPARAPITVQESGYFDFDSRTKFVGIYIPKVDADTTYRICGHFCEDYSEILTKLQHRKNLSLEQSGIPGTAKSEDLMSSGRLLVYHETSLPKDKLDDLNAFCFERGVSLQSRGPDYLESQKP